MIKKLVNTLYLENGELYVTIGGRRVLLAECRPKIEIYEHLINVKSIGIQKSYNVKKRHVVLVLCADLDFTREVNEDFLQNVTKFELSADIQRTDGVFEKILFDNINPTEIDLDNDWIFEADEYQEIVKKLIAL